ncbi:E3 ubiquitin-protein ligase RNF166 [Labeo rohita]|uniref:E3 ubiquitin-protein ligase RNF166 n=1 Tax=Labeo rohita TaxID=84645 RepID=A0ABQ8LN92_LABRO|nr:E3 ubiquitin-protein ligase hrd-1 [Labeo rohita]KAI2651855.1 E3 ubiquitin-protein ligase RNF166 [Labeo rohita]
MSASEEECPVCRENIQNPSQPSACCGKVICQRCLNQSFRFRPHCPYCRTSLVPPGRRSHMQQMLPGGVQTFSSRRPVGANIQNLLGQLQNSMPQQAGIAAQAAPPLAPQNRPVPLPRNRAPLANLIAAPQPAPINAAPIGLIQPAPPPAPAPLPVNHVTPQENLLSALDEWPWQTEISLMEMNPQPQGVTVRTFTCPYCQDNGLDELDLLDHCNEHHANDSTRVVCPVCVQTPHGDPQYYSRNFIGHLNLRHCYYLDDITNLHQSDEMNFQCAILASYRENF